MESCGIGWNVSPDMALKTAGFMPDWAKKQSKNIVICIFRRGQTSGYPLPSSSSGR
jgi:hypothetical protein